MGILQIILLITLPFLAQIREAEAGCCCCCCPSCCCKPIIIKLPPPPVKLCPCCCGCGCGGGCCCCKPCCCCCCKPCCCCCCKPCCCCCPCCCCGGGGGGRKRRSVVDLMARKFSDVLLPQHNQDAMMSGMNGGGCGGGASQGVSLSPLHALCSQIPPSQRGPACQQITQHAAAQQFPLSQNIFNRQQQGAMMTSPAVGGGDFECANCPNCQAGTCQGCTGAGQAFPANCDAGAAGGQHCNCAAAGGLGNGGNPSAFHPLGEDNAFGQSFDAPSPCSGGLGGASGGGRRKRRAMLLRYQPMPFGPAPQEGAKTKREVKNQLVFRNNLEFVLRQSPPALLSANL
ncbi:hypothetical protein niasHS_000194 [Heterodera schachtii]|uniref:Uncharacterized protein n=2 Tax=Heterodera TaxID=34509 RepID=A0ABD2KC85_HETSC